MPTIFDIAKKAGVSITTVSRALNGYSDVAEETRQKVMRIAEELNYYPNAAARSLQGKRTNVIAFAPWLRDHVDSEPFFKEFIGVLALACLKHDLSLLVTVGDSPKNTNEIYRELAGSGRVDGIILADIKPQDERIALLQEINIPFVAFGRTADYTNLSYPFVDVDGAQGMKQVVGYLHHQGHRRIAYLSGSASLSYALHRFSGYQEALKEFGLEDNSKLVRWDLQEPEEVERAVAALMAMPLEEQPTALVSSNDRLALNVIAALKGRGIQVGRGPGQIAVTGFDDLPFAAYVQPAITTVRQPIEVTSATLLNLLVMILRQKEEETPPESQTGLAWLGPRQILLQPELVVRDSA